MFSIKILFSFGCGVWCDARVTPTAFPLSGWNAGERGEGGIAGKWLKGIGKIFFEVLL
jgi:hypothetical protein